MSTKGWLGLAAIVVAAAAMVVIALPGGAEWTTDSPEARAELEAAIEAQMKLYHGEVQAHLEKALELDPDFVIVKLYLADQIRENDSERVLELWNDVLAADLSRLSPRERLLIERARAIQERRFEDAERMVDAYLTDHPNDPFVLHRKALTLWITGEFDEAERLNRRLIEIAPNWVVAYNQLGYISMSRGRFVEAEEYFKSYRFVAPDQANPHDSLGELYLLLGRYDEAESSLLRSIETKPDFWAAYDHLALVRMMRSDFAGAADALAAAEARGDMPEYWRRGVDCWLRYAELVAAGRYRDILELFEREDEDESCLKGHSGGYVTVTIHRAACLTAEWEVAQTFEEEMIAPIEAVEKGTIRMDQTDVEGLLAHMRGVRLAVEGDNDGALEAFRTADDHMSYMQVGIGLFKLYNRLFTVETLFASGRDAKAHQLLSEVRSVNPVLVDEFEARGLHFLGLDRRSDS